MRVLEVQWSWALSLVCEVALSFKARKGEGAKFLTYVMEGMEMELEPTARLKGKARQGLSIPK
jgi:hypothetical protein